MVSVLRRDWPAWFFLGVQRFLADANPHPPGKWQGLHPEFARRLHYFCADHPGLYVLSGHRSSEEQAYLYQHQSDPGFNPANPPGSSNHEAIPYGAPLGIAADLTPESLFDSGNLTNAAHDQIKQRYGLHFPLRLQENEDHHCQPVEVPSPKWTGMPDLPRWDFAWRG